MDKESVSSTKKTWTIALATAVPSIMLGFISGEFWENVVNYLARRLGKCVAVIPRNPSGKVLRRELREP